MKLEPIDTRTTVGKARVMQLAAEGRKVAYSNSGDHEWASAKAPLWDWRTLDYGIIAEPVGPDEVWVQQRDGALWAYPEDREGSVRYVRAEE